MDSASDSSRTLIGSLIDLDDHCSCHKDPKNHPCQCRWEVSKTYERRIQDLENQIKSLKKQGNSIRHKQDFHSIRLPSSGCINGQLPLPHPSTSAFHHRYISAKGQQSIYLPPTPFRSHASTRCTQRQSMPLEPPRSSASPERPSWYYNYRNTQPSSMDLPVDCGPRVIVRDEKQDVGWIFVLLPLLGCFVWKFMFC